MGKTTFGSYGGQYIPETLHPAVNQLAEYYEIVKKDPDFFRQLNDIYKDFVGRPTPLYFAKNISKQCNLNIYLKREDLNHTGAHKINNALGQVLMAIQMGKKRIIAETGAGQHGVATATACAYFGIKCVVYMGQEDVRRQALNVKRMTLMGATVVPVTGGSKTLKDATSEAMRDWLKNVEDTHYVVGSVVGPHPFPTIVRDFQSIIGKESKQQFKDLKGCDPDVVMACVGGGSKVMGLFHEFIPDKHVELLAVEAAGDGIDTNRHSASLAKGKPGILHGSNSYLLQTDSGQVDIAHSISAGLDYPGVGPELSLLKDQERLSIDHATDTEALDACKWLAESEGIIPALETAHAFAVLKRNERFEKDTNILVNLSGRGDKDMQTIMEHMND